MFCLAAKVRPLKVAKCQ